MPAGTDNHLVIRGLDLGRGLTFAPMAGITDSAVRRLAKSFGPDLVCSEMIAAKALHMVKRTSARERLLELALHKPEEKPISVQLFGSDPETFPRAAELVLEKGADIVDINAGCPAKKVVNSGSGSVLLKDPVRLGKIIGATRSVGDFPLTVKIRLGWDESSVNFLEVARIAVEEGVDAIVLHARTRSQMFGGQARWEKIAELVQAVPVPVIGNGDVVTGKDALRMIRQTGCAGVMVGRAANGRPWVFAEMRATLDGKEAPAPPTPMEVHALFERHFAMLMETKGEKGALLEIRKHLLWYTKGQPGATQLRRTLYTFTEPARVRQVAREFFESAQTKVLIDAQAQ